MLALQPFFHGDNRVKLTESGFRADVGGLFAFGPLDDIKGDFLAFFQGLETLRLHRTEVSEEILATFVRGNEAEAFSVVEPLDSTRCHTFDIPARRTSAETFLIVRGRWP